MVLSWPDISTRLKLLHNTHSFTYCRTKSKLNPHAHLFPKATSLFAVENQIVEKHQATMSGKKIRFLSSSEKMTSLGKRSRIDERLEGDPNGFISVLIDGNCFQVSSQRNI